MLRKWTAALCAVLLMLTAAAAEEEKSMMGFDDIVYTPGYKKAGEGNPLFTQRFGADPGAMVYGDKVYVFTTNDVIEYDASGNIKENTYARIDCINCICSEDLCNWQDLGAIPVAGRNGIARWATCSWAPCAAHKVIDGKERFFLYFCNGGNGIGVLTADAPEGPWRDELGHALITRKVPTCAAVPWLFDPAVMVDEDGTGYLCFGGGVPEGKEAAPGTARIVKLREDMMSLDGTPAVIDAPYLFEDSGINRIGDQYVYSYCANWQADGNALRIGNGTIQYMTSDRPMGPYTWQGELFANEGKFFGMWGNNHHSVAEFKGRYYLFYHNRPVEKAMGITGNYRSPQVDRIMIREDGKIASVLGTMKGPGQLQPLDPFCSVPAALMCDQGGIEVLGVGDTWVSGIDRGDWISVSGVDFGSGCERIILKARSLEGCLVKISYGRANGKTLGIGEIPAGEEWTEVSIPVQAEGKADITFAFSGQAEFLSWSAR